MIMKTLIITGGSSGIGKETVKLFASKGYKVYELSRHGESQDGVTHIYCDVSDPESCTKAVDAVVAESGKIDLLICNAGMGISGAIEFTEVSEMRSQIDVNLYGSIFMAQAVLPYMRKARSGRILFVSSLAGIFALPFQAFYSVSKFGVIAFAMALKNEVKPFGISVACMVPGDVRTGFTNARRKNDTGADIYKSLNKSVSSMEHDETNGIHPIEIAKKLYKMAESRNPSAINTVGLQYKFFLLLNKILPTTLIYKIVGLLYAPTVK